MKKKTERREKVREAKAEKAANIEIAIEKELLQRLEQGTYGEIYNYPPQMYESYLEGKEVPVEEEDEVEYVEEDLEESEVDIEDLAEQMPVKRRKVLEVEYEKEIEELGKLSR